MSSQGSTSGTQITGSKAGKQKVVVTRQYVSSSTTRGSSSQYPSDSSQRPNTLIRSPPGKRCPTCAAKGFDAWAFSGKDCGYCGTYIE